MELMHVTIGFSIINLLLFLMLVSIDSRLSVLVKLAKAEKKREENTLRLEKKKAG